MDLNLSVQIYKGNIIHTPTPEAFEIIDHGYIIVKNALIEQVVEELPPEYQNLPVNDFGDKLIIPGLCDLHLHAPQFPNRGLCLDYPLLDWLQKCTFPLEVKFSDLHYARHIYSSMIHSLWENGNLRSLIYNTIHFDATVLLFNMMKESGLGAFVGIVNSDINAPEYILQDTDVALREVEEYIRETKNRCHLVHPIIAPRFVVTCSPRLLEGLGDLAQKYRVPVMSHLSESVEEIEMVHEMYPDVRSYADVYNRYGLLGQEPTVMAHCIYSDDYEIDLLSKNGVYVDHNPSSNLDLGNGLMPVRKFLDKGIKVGLGCDVAGGGNVSLFKVMVDALATSKIISLFSRGTLKPLNHAEIFYMATRGGGRFFGNVGCFSPGFEFDALVIDDTPLLENCYTTEERIERFTYIGTKQYIKERYVAGRHITEPSIIPL